MNLYQNELTLPGQAGSGLGDPYVFRFNGLYYLYPSTPADEYGVRVWISRNLIDWRDGGWVVRDACLQNAYAPEVLYVNGKFFLVTSPFGRGHYLYEGASPAGPFHKVQDNFGRVIDGSMFADDDGQLYFFYAEYPALHGCKMGAEGVLEKGREIKGTSMGHWTEGPGVFKRNGKYYITMTGNHLFSRAYRIDYAISEVGPLGPYRVPEEKTLLVNTDRAYGSLGHSSTIIGPDLDSYWIFYHNYEIDDRGHHIRRNVNLDRLLFNNERLIVSGPTRGFVQAPDMPDAYGWADEPESAPFFTREKDCVLLRQATGEDYTAEATFEPGNKAEMIFGWKGHEDYLYVCFAEEQVTAGAVCRAMKEVLLEKGLYDGFFYEALHTVRLEVRDGKLNLLIDHMLQAEGIVLPWCAGHIGVKGSKKTSYLAFSRHVGQRSDHEHYHAIPGPVDAAFFLPSSITGEVGSFSPDACGFRPEDGVRMDCGSDGGQDVWLSGGEELSYRIMVQQADVYRVQCVVEARENSVLEIDMPSGTLKEPLAKGAMSRKAFSDVILRQGPCVWRLKVLSGELVLRQFHFFPKDDPISGSWSGLPLALMAEQVEGMGSDGFLIRHEGLQMDREVQAMGMFGQRFLCNGWIEASLRFRGQGVDKSAGLFLRLSENSYHPDQIRTGHRGYYVGFDTRRVWISRMNFNEKELACAFLPLEIETTYRMKASIDQGEIIVYVDDEEVLRTVETDPLPYGKAAVGSFGARITVETVSLDMR